MTRLVVISPHLDDAVFSCGTLIATAALIVPVRIVTVCAGVPAGDAAPAIRMRRAEDELAASVLGAEVEHLHLMEGADADEMRRVLGSVFALEDTTFFGPLGLRHADHQHVAEACEGHAQYLYEELPYRVLWPEFLPHPAPTPVLELPSSAIKQAAVACYQSQLGGPAGEALHAGERYHRA